jgi:hypothetical protein
MWRGKRPDQAGAKKNNDNKPSKPQNWKPRPRKTHIPPQQSNSVNLKDRRGGRTVVRGNEMSNKRQMETEMERKETTTQIFQNAKDLNTRQSTNQTDLPLLVFINQTYLTTMSICE